MSPDLELALALADAADAISLPRFRTGLTVETKPDLTPVTEVDRAVEVGAAPTHRRGAPGRCDPRRGVRGQGRLGAPLDPRPDRRDEELLAGSPGLGNADRARGEGRVQLGVVTAPSLSRRWWAERGERSLRGSGARPASRRWSGSRTPSSRFRSTGSCRRWPSRPGTSAASATSGRTCSSPRAPWTVRSTRPAWASGHRRGAGDHRRGGRSVHGRPRRAAHRLGTASPETGSCTTTCSRVGQITGRDLTGRSARGTDVRSRLERGSARATATAGSGGASSRSRRSRSWMSAISCSRSFWRSSSARWSSSRFGARAGLAQPGCLCRPHIVTSLHSRLVRREAFETVAERGE